MSPIVPPPAGYVPRALPSLVHRTPVQSHVRPGEPRTTVDVSIARPGAVTAHDWYGLDWRAGDVDEVERTQRAGSSWLRFAHASDAGVTRHAVRMAWNDGTLWTFEASAPEEDEAAAAEQLNWLAGLPLPRTTPPDSGLRDHRCGDMRFDLPACWRAEPRPTSGPVRETRASLVADRRPAARLTVHSCTAGYADPTDSLRAHAERLLDAGVALEGAPILERDPPSGFVEARWFLPRVSTQGRPISHAACALDDGRDVTLLTWLGPDRADSPELWARGRHGFARCYESIRRSWPAHRPA